MPRDLGLYAVVVWGLTSTVTQYAQFGWMGRLQHRFEWGPLGSGGYYLREVWWNIETGESLPYPQGT